MWEHFNSIAFPIQLYNQRDKIKEVVSVPLHGCTSWTITIREKARLEIHKDVVCCFKQILEVAPYKTAVVRSLTSHLTNYSNKTNKTCWLLLEKWLWTHKQHYGLLHMNTPVLADSSSSSCRAISTDIPNPLLPPLSIMYCFCQVFRATFRISTELLYEDSSWSSCLCSSCLCSSMLRGLQEYIVPTSPAVSRMSGSFNFDSFRNG